MNKLIAQVCWFVSIIVSLPLLAQEQPAPAATAESSAATNSPAVKNVRQEKDIAQPMAREANINLRTTVTGNQEQPRVMYILPWQSPASPDLDMEMLSSQQDAVFGHVERDELMRDLEASDEPE